jgi:hypothetical protein
VRHLSSVLRRRRHPGRAAAEGGLALVTVLAIIFVISALVLLVLDLAGKEVILSRGQRAATDALYLADGGATVAREAVYQLVESLQNAQTVAGGQTQLAGDLATIYANNAPLAILNYAGFKSSSNTCCNTLTNANWNSTWTGGSAPATYEVVSQVANYPTMYLALYTGDQVQSLGDGSYTAKVTITPRQVGGVYIKQSGPPTAYSYTFYFTYSVLSRGVSLQATRQVQVQKDFDVTIAPGSFADYAFFSNFFGPPPSNGRCTNNGYFTTGNVFNGPVFTNGKLWLAGDPVFDNSVGSANYSFSYQNGQCVAATQAPQGYVHFYNNGNPQDIADWCSPRHTGSPPCSADNPTYMQGGANFNRLANMVPMPGNAYSQIRAAIGGNPGDTSAVTNQEINQDLGLCSNTCSTNPPPNGVYLPAAGSPATLSGGVYIQDSHLAGMSFSIDGSGNQVITVTQTNPSAQVSTQVVAITINQTANQTTVATVQTLTGGGQRTSTATYAGQPNGMIYTSGSIAALGGRTVNSSSSCPGDSSDLGQNPNNTSLAGSCIQSNTALDVAAGGDININENIIYQTQPTSSGTQPANILGIYSATGNVMVTNAPPILTTDAFVMSGGGQIGVTNYGSVYANTGSSTCGGQWQPDGGCWNNLGGQISYYAGYTGTFNGNGLASGYNQNIVFDARPLNGQAVPPYFPVALQYTATINDLFDTSANRASWREVY